MKYCCLVLLRTTPFLIVFFFVFQCNAQISDFNTINFQKADSIALEHNNETLQNLPELAYKLTSNLSTEVERFRAIYMWVCTTIANDYRLYSKNRHKRKRFKNDSLKLKEWNDKFRRKTFKRLLRRKTTICTGYAYLVKKLSDLANINCVMVDGYARTSTIPITELDTPNHSWNAVELNGKWYLCDPTWASGIPHPETNLFQFKYNNGFFLAHPRLFSVNHYPLDEKWLLLEDNLPSFENFIEAPIIYGKAYAHLNAHLKPEKLHNSIGKQETVIFKYELLNTIKTEDIQLLIDNGYGSKKTQPQSTSVKDNTLTITHTFTKPGLYDVHLYLENDLIATYVYEVGNE